MPNLYFGKNNPIVYCIGSSRIKKLYKGNTLIYGYEAPKDYVQIGGLLWKKDYTNIVWTPSYKDRYHNWFAVDGVIFYNEEILTSNDGTPTSGFKANVLDAVGDGWRLPTYNDFISLKNEANRTTEKGKSLISVEKGGTDSLGLNLYRGGTVYYNDVKNEVKWIGSELEYYLIGAEKDPHSINKANFLSNLNGIATIASVNYPTMLPMRLCKDVE